MKIDPGCAIHCMVRDDLVAGPVWRALAMCGGEVFAVGGVVRDMVLGVAPHDIDLLVRHLDRAQVREALENLASRHGGKVSEVGKSFGIFEYRNADGCVQVSVPRLEHSLGVHHVDFEIHVDPEMTIEEDLIRRDYTCNGMAVDLLDSTLIDPMNGLDDTRSRRLVVTTPQMIAEDPLRIVRALSLAARRSMSPDAVTFALLRQSSHTVQYLPVDRVRNELDKIMESDEPQVGIVLAHLVDVLRYVLPEVEDCMGYDQNNKHHEKELGEHLLSVLERICLRTHDKDLRLAALLHDIGKPASAWTDPVHGTSHFYEYHPVDEDSQWTGEVWGADHEVVGAEMTYSLMRRLHYATARVNRVVALVRHHMYPGFSTTTGARRFLAKIEPHADDLLLLRWADSGGKGDRPDPEYDEAWDADKNSELVDRVRSEESAFSLKDLAVSGQDLLDLGMSEGPALGKILQSLLQTVIEEPTKNNRDELLDLVCSGHVVLGR